MKNLSTELVYEDFIRENIYPGFPVPEMIEPENSEPRKFGLGACLLTTNLFLDSGEGNILMVRKQQVLGYTTVEETYS